MPFWHASVGKNTAHMVADEDILVNVDNDNLIGKGFPEDDNIKYTMIMPMALDRVWLHCQGAAV